MGTTTVTAMGTVMGTAMTIMGKGNKDNSKDNNDGKDNKGRGGGIPARQTTIN